MKMWIKSSLLGILMLASLSVSGLTQVPDIGGRIVFVSDRDGSPNLYVMDLDNLEPNKITEFPGELGITYVCFPHWSKDGKRILFGANTPEHWYQIYLVNDDGTGLRRLTSYQNYAQYNQWDPINESIFYCLQTVGWGNEYFHKVNIETGEDLLIPMSPDFGARGTSGNDGFDITPDGTEILFTRNNWYQYAYIGYQDMSGLDSTIIADLLPRLEMDRINTQDGWILFSTSNYFPGYPPLNMAKMDKLGASKVILTAGAGGERNEFGSWVGGGNDDYIIFQSNYYGNYEIVLMRADGNSYPAGMINLTNNPSFDSHPDWTPIGSYAAMPELYLDEGVLYLSLNRESPTSSTPLYIDSPPVNRSAYREIGTWETTPDVGMRLGESAGVDVWLGLKNSDDQGTYFDLKVEILKNDAVIATGETLNIRGITRNPSKALKATVNVPGIPAGTIIGASGTLALRVSTKVTATGGHSNAVGLRLYYDGASQASKIY